MSVTPWAANMRYLNWDVLLFPTGSKAPLQEFKASCYVTEDLGPYLCFSQGYAVIHFLCTTIELTFLKKNSEDPPQIQTITSHGYTSEHVVPRLMPTVACFIPNLAHGIPFRISLHSWEPPAATHATKALAIHGSTICFEARVLLDGICVA